MKTEKDKFYGHLNSFMEMLGEVNWTGIIIAAAVITAVVWIGLYFWWRRLKKGMDGRDN